MRLTVDIMQDFIASLKLSGNVISLSNDGTNTTLAVKATYHARTDMQLEVDSISYPIVSVVNNESITIEGVLVSASIYKVPNPFYFHGTPVMTNEHIKGAEDDQKNPMVYLYEILRERDLPPSSRTRRESELRLFFLDNANFSDWETDDHYTYRLLGLNNLVDAFEEQARNYRCCFYLFETVFTRINHVKWGTWKSNSGHDRNLFDDNLTGVELSFTLPLLGCK